MLFLQYLINYNKYSCNTIKNCVFIVENCLLTETLNNFKKYNILKILRITLCLFFIILIILLNYRHHN